MTTRITVHYKRKSDLSDSRQYQVTTQKHPEFNLELFRSKNLVKIGIDTFTRGFDSSKDSAILTLNIADAVKLSQALIEVLSESEKNEK